MLRPSLNPMSALRLATHFFAWTALLAAALCLGFHAGAGHSWAHHVLQALAGAALLGALSLACFVTRSIRRSAVDAMKIAKRMDRAIQHADVERS